MLNLIVRYGAPASAALAVGIAALLLWLCFASLGWGVVALAAFGGAVAFVVARSYVELVVLVTDMLLPR